MYRSGIVSGLDISVDVLHGTGTEQGHDGGDVLHAAGLEPHGHVRHAGGFHLKHTGGLAPSQHIEHRLIVVVQVLPVHGDALAFQQLEGVIDDGQVAQAQKVHLQKAQLLQRGHHILADHALIAPGEGHIFIHRRGGDDDSGGVGGAVPGHTLDLSGHVQQIFDAGVVVIIPLQLRGHLQGLVQRHFQFLWHGLGHHVHLGIGHIHHPAHVPHHGAGSHGAKGDDLGHMVLAVFARDIVDDLLPAAGAEVDVEVGHTHPLGVDEPLKEQTVAHGVHIGDVHAVGRHGSRAGTAARPHGNALGLGVVDEIGHDEEVFHKAHPRDHVQLVAQAVPVLLGGVWIPSFKALPAQLFHIGPGVGLTLRQLEGGQVVFPENKVKIAHFGDPDGVFHGLRSLREQRRHLVAGFHIEFRPRKAHPVGILQGLAGLDAQQHVVHLVVLPPQVVGVVGSHQGDAGLPVQLQKTAVDGLLLGDAVVLQLQIIISPAEQRVIAQGGLLCSGIIAVHQQALHLPRQTGGQAHQAPGVLLQKVPVHPGLVVKALGKACGAQLDKILVALLVFAQQNQVPRLIVQLVHLVKPGAGRHVQLAADDGLDPRLFGGLVEIHAAVHDAVVGDGHRGLAQLLDPLHQRTQAAGAIQQAVFGM